MSGLTSALQSSAAAVVDKSLTESALAPIAIASSAQDPKMQAVAQEINEAMNSTILAQDPSIAGTEGSSPLSSRSITPLSSSPPSPSLITDDYFSASRERHSSCSASASSASASASAVAESPLLSASPSVTLDSNWESNWSVAISNINPNYVRADLAVAATFDLDDIVAKITRGDHSKLFELRNAIRDKKESPKGFLSRMLTNVFIMTLIPQLQNGDYSLFEYFIEWTQHTKDSELIAISERAFEITRDDFPKAILDSLYDELAKTGMISGERIDRNLPLDLHMLLRIIIDFKKDTARAKPASFYMEKFNAAFDKLFATLSRISRIRRFISQEALVWEKLNQIAYIRMSQVRIDGYLSRLVPHVIRSCPSEDARAERSRSPSASHHEYSSSAVASQAASAVSSEPKTPLARLHAQILDDYRAAKNLSGKFQYSGVRKMLMSGSSSFSINYSPFDYNYPFIRKYYRSGSINLNYIRTPTPFKEIGDRIVAPQFMGFLLYAESRNEPVIYCNHQKTEGIASLSPAESIEAERVKMLEAQQDGNFHVFTIPYGDGPIFDAKKPALADLTKEGAARFSNLNEKLLDAVLNEKYGMRLPKLLRDKFNRIKELIAKQSTRSAGENAELEALRPIEEDFIQKVTKLISDIKKQFFPKETPIDSFDRQMAFFMMFSSYYKMLITSYLIPRNYSGSVHFASPCKDCKDRGNSSMLIDETIFSLLNTISNEEQMKRIIQHLTVHYVAVPYLVNTDPILKERFLLALNLLAHLKQLESLGKIPDREHLQQLVSIAPYVQ